MPDKFFGRIAGHGADPVIDLDKDTVENDTNAYGGNTDDPAQP